MLTSDAIAAQVSTALQRPVTYDEVLLLAASGKAAASTVVEAAGDALGRFIRDVLHRIPAVGDTSTMVVLKQGFD